MKLRLTQWVFGLQEPQFVVQFPYGKSLKGATMFEISADSSCFGDYLDELEQLGIWSDDEDFWLDYEDYDED